MDRIAVDGDTFLKSLHFYCGNVRVLVFAEKKGKEKKMGVSFALRLRLFTRRWFDRTRAPRQSKKKKKGLTFAFSGMHQCSLLTLSVCKTCFNVSKKKNARVCRFALFFCYDDSLRCVPSFMAATSSSRPTLPFPLMPPRFLSVLLLLLL